MRTRTSAFIRSPLVTISLLILTALACPSILPLTAQAADGGLDTSLGNSGLVTTDFFGDVDEGFGIAVQPDGKIIVAGYASTPQTGSHFSVARYDSGGNLDPTFGAGGKVITDLTGHSFAVAIQRDGKIILAGSTFSNFITGIDLVLMRLDINGNADPSFGSNGLVATDFSNSYDEPYALTLQPDGKIITAGLIFNEVTHRDNLALARYNTDGSLDSSFGQGGKVTAQIGALDCAALSLLLQPDGKIVAGGASIELVSGHDFAVVRFNSNGTFDTTFGAGGKTITDFFDSPARDHDQVTGLAYQPDGGIVAAGFATDQTRNTFFALARYKADGSLDTSFGAGGKVTTDFSPGLDKGRAVILQPDGKILVVGTAFSNSSDFALARYNTDGSLDSGFGSGGKSVVDFSGAFDEARAVALQADGKIVAAGLATGASGLDFALARFESGLIVPEVTGVSLTGKKLVVSGERFDAGAVILLNGKAMKTIRGEQNPAAVLTSKKAGKKIKSGDTVQVRNSTGIPSNRVVFTF